MEETEVDFDKTAVRIFEFLLHPTPSVHSLRGGHSSKRIHPDIGDPAHPDIGSAGLAGNGSAGGQGAEQRGGGGEESKSDKEGRSDRSGASFDSGSSATGGAGWTGGTSQLVARLVALASKFDVRSRLSLMHAF